MNNNSNNDNYNNNNGNNNSNHTNLEIAYNTPRGTQHVQGVKCIKKIVSRFQNKITKRSND